MYLRLGSAIGLSDTVWLKTIDFIRGKHSKSDYGILSFAFLTGKSFFWSNMLASSNLFLL